MTLYTVTAFKKVEKDLARLSHIFNAVAPFLTLVYLCYALIVGFGNTVINVVGLALSFLYFLYYLIFLFRLGKMNEQLKKDKSEIKQIKKQQRNTKRVYKVAKICVGFISLAISTYTVYITLSNVTPLSVLLVGLSAVAWVLNLVIFCAYEFFSNKVEFIIAGVQYDLERINPVKNVKDAINRAQGREIEVDTEKISAKNRNLLDKLVEKEKENRPQQVSGISKVKNIINTVLHGDNNSTPDQNDK